MTTVKFEIIPTDAITLWVSFIGSMLFELIPESIGEVVLVVSLSEKVMIELGFFIIMNFLTSEVINNALRKFRWGVRAHVYFWYRTYVVCCVISSNNFYRKWTIETIGNRTIGKLSTSCIVCKWIEIVLLC